MKKQIIGIFFLCLTATHAYAIGYGFQIGGLQVNPSISVIESHDNNITKASSRPISSWITEGKPMLNIIGGSYINYITLQSNFDGAYYKDSPSHDYNDYYVGVSTHNEASYRSALDTDFYYNKSHDQVGSILSGSAVQFANPSVWTEVGVNARLSYGGINIINHHLFNTAPTLSSEIGHTSALLPENVYNRIEISSGYSRKHYFNNLPYTNIFNVHTTYVDGIFYYQLAPRIATLLEGRYDYFDYTQPGSPRKSRELELYTGLSWEFTGSTRGELKVGMQRKTFTIGSSPAPYFSWEAQVEWLPRTYSIVILDSGIKSTEATTATGTFVKSDFVHLTWNHHWNSRLEHSISYNFDRDHYFGSTRVDNITTAGISVNYRIVHWLNIGIVYDYQKRNSNALYSTYNDNIYLLSLNATL